MISAYLKAFARLVLRCGLMLCAILSGGLYAAEPPAAGGPAKLTGDLGLAGFANQSPVRGVHASPLPLPYIYADYGRAFGRVDTFGIRTLKMGYGNLELVGRVNVDGYTSNDNALRHLTTRHDSIPLGLGSYQETPVGGFFMYAFHDVAHSKGNLAELIYAAELDLGKCTLYPMLGLEYRSAAYNRYYYGVDADEALRTGSLPSYTPGSATIPQAALWLDIPLRGALHLNIYGRVKWLPNTLKHSPLLERGTESNVFAALAYRFE